MLAFFGLKGAAAKESWATVDVNVPQAQAQMIASPTSTEQEPVERARTKTQPHTANAQFFWSLSRAQRCRANGVTSRRSRMDST